MEYSISYGVSTTPKVQCINPTKNRWMVRWDYQVVENDDTKNPDEEDPDVPKVINVQFGEALFEHKPELLEIKDIVLKYYNDLIDLDIYNFQWNGHNVYLSVENQENFKAAYMFAKDTGGATLPVTFKFGDQYNPDYYQFNTVEELTEFYYAAYQHICNALMRGWMKKDTIDWSEYEI